MDWKHDDLAADLAGYLSSQDTMIWTDMQLGPSGSPRPDVYTIRKSYSKPLPLAFECKISRSDLRSDTTSGKWQSYLKYASGVVFAVPDGLCTVADIPDGAGLILRKAKEWRYARRPTLAKVTPPFDACMKLLIDGVHRTYRTPTPTPRRLALWEEQAAVRKKFGKEVADCARDIVLAYEHLERLRTDISAEASEREKLLAVKHEAARATYAAEERQWSALKTEILQFLGMENGSLWGAQRKFGELRSQCDADARVEASERKLQSARRAVESALNALPKIEPVAGPWGIPA